MDNFWKTRLTLDKIQLDLKKVSNWFIMIHVMGQKGRFYFPFLTGVFFISLLVYFWIVSTVPGGILQTIKIERYYALITLFLLYVVLLEAPFSKAFSKLGFIKEYKGLMPTLIVSTFYFSLLHFLFSFFGELGGFEGLLFLGNSYLVAIALSLTALTILFLVVLGLFNVVVSKLKFLKSKVTLSLLYIAGLLVLIHALMLGSDFTNLSGVVAQIVFVALVFLLILIAHMLDLMLSKKRFPQFGLAVGLMLVAAVSIYTLVLNPFSESKVTFDIHAAHKQLAKDALQASTQNSGSSVNTSNIPGLNGDRTRRYTVSMSTDPAAPVAGQDTTIRFKVNDASTSLPVTLFQTLYDKKIHFIIVNNDLTYFSHIHPELIDGEFVITTQFPKDDIYHLYIEFQPFGGIEQQVGFTLPVGTNEARKSTSKPDDKKAKVFGDYKVSMDTHGVLSAKDMTVGAQTITMTIKDAKTGKGVTNLKPYLASFGHLTLINQKTFDFIHVHPYNLNPPAPNANGGPTVDFLPIGIYGPFKPGIYRAFAELNPDGKLFTSDFTVEVK